MSKYYIKVVGRAFPKTSEEILAMIANGRLTPETEASVNAVEWRRLADIDEFRGAFNRGGAPGAFPGAPAFGAPTPAAPVGPSMNEPIWYATTDGANKFGPLTAAQILSAYQSGKLPPTTQIWRDGASHVGIAEFAAAMNPAAAIPAEAKEWYYSADGQTGYGPYAVSEILAFLEQGRINFSSLVWRQGENSRPIRNEPAIMNAYNAAHSGAAMPMNVGAPMVNTGAYDSRNDGSLSQSGAVRENKSLKLCRMLSWILGAAMLACILAGGVCYGIAEAALSGTPSVDSIITVLTFVRAYRVLAGAAGLLMLGIMVPVCVFIYRVWKSIPREFARTTPGKAVGLLYIPFFWLYWQFVALRGAAYDLDKTLTSYSQSGKSVGEEPALARTGAVTFFCVYICVAIVLPVLFAFAPLVFFFCTRGLMRAAMQLNCWRAGIPSQIPAGVSKRVTLDDVMNS